MQNLEALLLPTSVRVARTNRRFVKPTTFSKLFRSFRYAKVLRVRALLSFFKKEPPPSLYLLYFTITFILLGPHLYFGRSSASTKVAASPFTFDLVMSNTLHLLCCTGGFFLKTGNKSPVQQSKCKVYRTQLLPSKKGEKRAKGYK